MKSINPQVVHKNNLFDTMRHAAALMVIFSHHYALSGLHEPGIEGFETIGGIAVIMFFSISGFLITRSSIRSISFMDFMTKRVRRIFPALILCAVVVNVFAAWLFYDDPSIKRAIYSVLKTASLGGASLSGSSDAFVYTQLINGSLWTLPLEFACYLIVGFIILVGVKNIYFIVAMAVALLFSFYNFASPLNINAFSIPLNLFPVRMLSFFVGSVMAVSMSNWNNIKTKIFLVAFFFSYFITSRDYPETFIVSGFIFISITTIIICVSFNDFIVKGRFDYSYGIYIYAFPVQQIIIAKSGLGLYSGMAASTIVTVLLAAISWHLIEKRFLRRAR